jgi:hypothetical protein
MRLVECAANMGWTETSQGPRHTWEGNIKMNQRNRVGRHEVDSYPSQYRNQWQALVNTVMNLTFHERQAIPSVNEKLLALQGVCFMELSGPLNKSLLARSTVI